MKKLINLSRLGLIGLIVSIVLFSGCTLKTIDTVTNKITAVAKIGTSSYNVAKVFYKSGKTILVSGGIYNLLPLTAQAKLKALDTTLTTYDAFRTNVIAIIEEEVGKEGKDYIIQEEGNEVIIANISESSEASKTESTEIVPISK